MAPYPRFKTSKACELNNLRRLQKKFKMEIKTNINFVKNEVSKKNDGLTPLIRACRLGHLRVVRYLVTVCGADVHQVADQSAGYNNTEGMSPLLCAVMAGHQHIVEFLISAGADVNTTSHPTWTPLRAATYLGYPDIVKILLDNDADLEVATWHGYPHTYCKWTRAHNKIIVMLLLRFYKSIESFELYMHAVKDQHRENIVLLHSYLNRYDSVIANDVHDELPMMIKYMSYFLRVITSEAERNDGEFHTTLCVRILHQLYQVRDKLSSDDQETFSRQYYELLALERQRDVPGGVTMLHAVCLISSKREVNGIVEFLIKLGADVDAQDCMGNTPLHIVVKLKPFNAELVDLLIHNHAHIDMVDSNRNTPIDLQPSDATAISGLRYPLRHQSLLCLAARAVCQYWYLPYSDRFLPKPCIKAIQRHQIFKQTGWYDVKQHGDIFLGDIELDHFISRLSP